MRRSRPAVLAIQKQWIVRKDKAGKGGEGFGKLDNSTISTSISSFGFGSAFHYLFVLETANWTKQRVCQLPTLFGSQLLISMLLDVILGEESEEGTVPVCWDEWWLWTRESYTTTNATSILTTLCEWLVRLSKWMKCFSTVSPILYTNEIQVHIIC